MTDSLPGRGTGAILFIRRESGAVEAYYRRRQQGDTQKVKLGFFKRTEKSPGLSLSEIRDKAGEYARIAAEHGDVRAYLERCAQERMAEAAARELEQAEAARLAALEAAKGSLSDLFNDYIEDRKGNVTEDQIKEYERILKADLETAFPAIMAMKAKDVAPAHISELLSPIWRRGAKRQTEKVRAYLVAAFNFGLRCEHHIDRASRKSYGLTSNPAQVVVVPRSSTAGERALSDGELKQFWQTITKVKSIGPVLARLYQFAIATGGQRPDQIIREPWSSYDLDKKVLRLVDAKGRGGIRRIHLVPLTDRAIGILAEVREMQPAASEFPWSTNGTTPIHSSTPAGGLKKWFESDFAKIDGEAIPSFTPRDLRRTCTQLMQRHGVRNSDSDALQSHGQTGVVGKHYRNNPEAYLPEKRVAITAFDAALNVVLTS